MPTQLKDRVPSLDFLRSIAILLVVAAHSAYAFGAPDHVAWLQLGGTGVDLFFVLSGWLLGSHLFTELNRTGTVNVQRFWRRRWLRTLPAYFAVLGLTAIQFRLTKPEIAIPFEYLYFGQNYIGLPIFHVSWSLCVEEHFYLLVAPAILIGSRYRRTVLPMIAVALVVPALCRMCGFYGSPKQSHVRFDGCAMGVVLAMVASYQPAVWRNLKSNANRIGAVALAIYLTNFAVYYANSEQWFSDPGWFCWLSVAFVLFAVSSETNQQRMSFPGCQYLATRSYGIYLLHPEILALLKPWTASVPFSIFLLTTLFASCLVAEILYRLVELPVLAWRDRSVMRSGKAVPQLAANGKSAV